LDDDVAAATANLGEAVAGENFAGLASGQDPEAARLDRQGYLCRDRDSTLGRPA
jgi:hypothetical protein